MRRITSNFEVQAVEKPGSKYKVQRASKGVFFVLLLIITTFIIIIGPVRNYFAEMHRVQMLEKELRTANDNKVHAMGELERLKDSKYITAYAREHYAMILPGETAIHIANPDIVSNSKDIELRKDASNNLSKDASSALSKFKTPWYEKIYNSLIAPKVDQNAQKTANAPASASTSANPAQ
ncbi:MAG: septum formation initiator family protein [Candidatus Ancillula trichonymphae]|jgi:cell division protein FtsB|nr:septum formation initiator family protein [Candidatus Ancillula trichonymphae]